MVLRNTNAYPEGINENFINNKPFFVVIELTKLLLSAKKADPFNAHIFLITNIIV